MKIAMVASEAAPFAKTGGLADVAGALPKALFRLGHEAVLILPLYRSVRESGATLGEVARIQVMAAGRRVPTRLMQGEMPGADCPVYFLEQDDYFDRPGIYGEGGADYPDNAERFAFLSRGAIEAVRALNFQADVFHLHDWQSALVAPYLRLLYSADPLVRDAATVLTIHNLAHQGIFPALAMAAIGLDASHFTMREFEFWGKVNLLKAGIVYADAVNTVSPTYAAEIETPEFGCGLDGVLRDRAAALHGVVNGIDEAVWNPAADPLLPATYGPEDLSGKAACKRSLQRQVGLPVRKQPLAGIVSRFAAQKGLDLVADALPALLDQTPLQCVILGDGDATIAAHLEALAAARPDRLKVVRRFDERLAHRIIAGSDLCLVPSRFEPCGLTQLYALKYGTAPVVRRTGGLADTVVDCDPAALAAGQGTGFVFDEATPAALDRCVARALELYPDRRAWERLMLNGMNQNWSWESSAKRYASLYNEARESRRK